VRNGITLAVVLAVALLAALALADALRPGSESAKPTAQPSPTTTAAKPPTLRETLRSEAVTGLVLYSDRDCRLHSLLLPGLIDEVVRDDSGVDVFHCRFSVPQGHVLDGDVVAQPHGKLVARCRGDHIAVWNLETGEPVRSIRGCHPAWRPDGVLTYESRGRILAGRDVLLSRADLTRAARRAPGLQGIRPGFLLGVEVSDLAWPDDGHLVVGLQTRAPELGPPRFLAAVFQGNAITTLAAGFRGPYEHLFVSGDGLLAGADDGTVLTRSGRSVDPPANLPQGRAVAFTPDDRWLVWLTGSSTFLVEPAGGGDSRIIRLPVPARDLVWEPVSSGTSFGPPIRR
jgi:hypothetical protein